MLLWYRKDPPIRAEYLEMWTNERWEMTDVDIPPVPDLEIWDGRRAAEVGAGEMCPGGRQRRGEDPADLWASLQPGDVSLPATDHPRTYSLGHRPVQDLQRGQ